MGENRVTYVLEIRYVHQIAMKSPKNFKEDIAYVRLRSRTFL